jgi:internalin A
MSEQSRQVSRRWRRFLRFSVRGLIVIVLVIGAGLGWIVRSARIQRDAVAAITSVGYHVEYDWEWTNGQRIPGGKPRAPRRLVNLVGVDYFGRVTRVSYFQRGVLSHAKPRALLASTDRVLARPASDGRVQPGDLVTANMSEGNEMLVYLKGLNELSELDLCHNGVTDSGLVHLRGLTNLSNLDLEGNAITDSGLVHLRGLTELSDLNLIETKITDAGLRHLEGLAKLTRLRLNGTQVTDAGLAHLKGLASLTQLDLTDTRVTETGMIDLKEALSSLTIHH